LGKIKDVAQDRPDFTGRERNTAQVLLDVLAGIKITPVNEATQKSIFISNYKKEVEELRKQITAVQFNKIMKEEEKEAEIERLKQKVFDLVGRFQEAQQASR
jgi:hypothetical protein